jgi:signal transduction histidine kinase
MNAGLLDSLFMLDQQTSRPGTENEPSSGLGLLLSKEFVERHNGKISVQSEPGVGSTFTIMIPEIDFKNLTSHR